MTARRGERRPENAARRTPPGERRTMRVSIAFIIDTNMPDGPQDTEGSSVRYEEMLA